MAYLGFGLRSTDEPMGYSMSIHRFCKNMMTIGYSVHTQNRTLILNPAREKEVSRKISQKRKNSPPAIDRLKPVLAALSSWKYTRYAASPAERVLPIMLSLMLIHRFCDAQAKG